MTFSILKNQTKAFNQLLSKFCGQLLGTELQQGRRQTSSANLDSRLV